MIQPHPNHPKSAIERLRQEAEEAWEKQDYQKSIRLIEKVTRKEPRNPSRLLELASAYGRRYDFSAAERYIRKAVQLSTNHVHTLEEAGRTCLKFNNPDMALRYLHRASQKQGVTIGALIMLADIYIRDKRLGEAAELVARAAQIDRKDTRVLLEEAVLRRLHGKIQDAELLYRELLTSSDSGAPIRIRALYDLAGILDGDGRYDEAMSALREAKAMQRANAAPYAATLRHIQSRAKEMEQTITTDILDRWRAEIMQLQPPHRIALLCGHPRSGTTLLEQVLDAHSDVITAEETRLMHDEAYLPLIRDLPEGTGILQALDSASPGLIRRARENYIHFTEMLVGKKIGSHLLLDKNPALNLMIPMVVRIFPETRLIVALRDPRDVVLSCFMQGLPLTPISSAYLSLEDAVNQYANVMGFWLEMLPRMGDQWVHVRYEEMIDDLPSVARSVLKFLGLGFEDNVLKFYEHARTKRVNSPSHADVQKPIYRTAVGRWRNYEKYLKPHIPELDRFLKAFNYS